MCGPRRGGCRLSQRLRVENARNSHITVRCLQRPELLDDQEQEDHDRASGVLEVLSQVPEAHRPQRSEISRAFAGVSEPKGERESAAAIPSAKREGSTEGRKLNG